MVLSAKWSKSTPDGWGAMGGFLLIFFPPPPHSNSKKKPLPSLTPAPSPPFSGRLFSKTLSICSLFLLTTFLLFTLSPFEPSSAVLRHRPPRRLLLAHSSPPFSLSTHIVKFFNSGTLHHGAANHRNESSSFKALQGMGTLYRRGTRAMTDLLVAHVSHDVDDTEFRTFLRILHAGGLLARSDLVFVFSSPSISSKLSPLIREENESLLKLVSRYDELNRTNQNSRGLAGLARYLRTWKHEKKEAKEAIWGKGIRPTNQSELEESTRTSYGSVVGFDASELDPENSLSGFLDHAPMGLRRWACYPMLLGRLRRSYKHVILADVESVLVVSDPVARVRNRSPESVYFWAYPDSESGKRGKRQPAKANHDPTIIPGIVAGGSRGVRRLSDAVLTEIVRAAIEHKGKVGKNAVTESGIVNQLVRGGHLLKNVNVINSAEPVWDAGQVFGSDSNAGSVYSSSAVVVQRGRGIYSNSNSMRDLLLCCWSDLHSEIYRDCLETQ